MPNTVQFDLTEVRRIAGELVDCSSAVAGDARKLRLPLCPPAPDPLSVHLAARITNARIQLATLGEAAADDLTRTAETLLSAAHHMKIISRWAGVGALGLHVSAPQSHFPITPRSQRDPLPVLEFPEPLTELSDNHILSMAVLLSAGDTEVTHPPAPAATITDHAAALATLAEALGSTWTTAAAAADTLSRFATWLTHTYAEAIHDLTRDVHTFNTAYTTVRTATATPALSYAAACTATLNGTESEPPAAAPVRTALADYQSLDIPLHIPEQFSLLQAPPAAADS